MPQLKHQNQKEEENNGKPIRCKEKYWDPNRGRVERSHLGLVNGVVVAVVAIVAVAVAVVAVVAVVVAAAAVVVAVAVAVLKDSG